MHWQYLLTEYIRKEKIHIVQYLFLVLANYLKAESIYKGVFKMLKVTPQKYWLNFSVSVWMAILTLGRHENTGSSEVGGVATPSTLPLDLPLKQWVVFTSTYLLKNTCLSNFSNR